MSKTIVLTGGGTAGHVMPNILLQKRLRSAFDEVIYIGSTDGIERSLISSETDYKYIGITTVKLRRKKIFANFKIPFLLVRGIREAREILRQYSPCVVFSKGGYVALPVVIAARQLNIPVVLHESDISMGLSNRLAKKYAEIICTNFAVTAKKYKNGRHTGSPIALSPLTKAEARQRLSVTGNLPLLLILGGSLGARALNNFAAANLDELCKNYFVFHISGKNNSSHIKHQNYIETEFFKDMSTLYRAADFAISRAGANSLYELMANHVLTVFVPLPKAESRGDQIQNADFAYKNALAERIFQEELNIKKVQNSLDFLKKHAQNIVLNIKNQNFIDGTDKIVDTICTSIHPS